MQDATYFKTVRISPTALIKMVMHARSGGTLEVMGIMQGYVDGTAFVVTDAFRLPVEGTETRVNAQGDADEYLIQYLAACREESRQENVIGWYHSHPGYGCWLSGIDVATQQLQQMQGPMVAIVIDPDRTVSANNVEIGAFRTYPEGYTAPNLSSGAQSVPLTKADDFGAHASKYYSLHVEHYKSTLDGKLLDMLWNKYWVQTLAQNPLLTNRDYTGNQMCDVAQRVLEAAGAMSRSGKGGGVGSSFGTLFAGGGNGGAGDGAVSKAMDRASALGDGGGPSGSGSGGGGRHGAKDGDQAVAKILRDVGQIAAKERAGLMAAEVKAQLFSSGSG